MTPALQVNNLSKRYGHVQAVSGISFHIAPGEIFGLLGPNGAGKTTTLECILGLRRPDSGSVHVNSIDVIQDGAGAKELIGAHLQFSSLHDQITPLQALNLFASFYPRHMNLKELLVQVELGEKMHQPFQTLSYGQKVRLEIALAIVHEPTLLLLDEPTSGLDPLGRQSLHDVILRLKSAGRAILFTTHHLEEAHRLCDRVAILQKGSITALDTPEALIAASKVPPWLIFKASGELQPQELLLLGGVRSALKIQEKWRLETTDMDHTIRDLMRLLEARGHKLLDLQIHRPTLEDVFLGVLSVPPSPFPAGGNA